MNKVTFFASKEDRWDDSMRAFWGNLSICPLLDYLELPYPTSEELLSICYFKVWRNTQKPCNNMAYLLVHTEDASEAESYGMALVWISPHQAWTSTMEEALGTSGPNWPYVLAQLYEGSKHTPLPKDKHLGVLPWGKAEESSYGWISQLEVHQLLSTGLQVVYLVGLNRSDQPVIIDLPELLHSSSSITINEHSYLRIDIPLPTPEEPECTTLPLGRVHATLAATTPKTSWKPRITLTAEVNDLLNQGMADDYNCESEHSASGKETAMKSDIPPPKRQRS